MSEELVVRNETGMAAWSGAAERGLQARQAREAIIASVLKPGADFGTIPGTQKPTLLKAGAEKIADSLNLYPDYETINRTEDWDRPLFAVTYRCTLRARGTEATVATGIGSCNSMEARYRWRSGARKCPKCGGEAIIKGKDEYGGGWLCFAKKGGCGAKYPDGDRTIEGQDTGRVENDDIYSLVNTVDKMAQKRALVAASLNLGFSEQFTQDMEDMPHDEPAPVRTVAQPKPKSDTGQWSGIIDRVAVREGTAKTGKPYRIVDVHAGSETFSTFSETIEASARAAQESGAAATIQWKLTAKGSRDIVSLEPAAE